MPVTYEIADNTIILHLTGIYGIAEIHAALNDAIAARGRPPVTGLLFDISKSESIASRTADEVRGMARFLAEKGDHYGRRLALVADTDAAFGLMRLGAVGVEAYGVASQVFRDADDARAWLASPAARLTRHG